MRRQGARHDFFRISTILCHGTSLHVPRTTTLPPHSPTFSSSNLCTFSPYPLISISLLCSDIFHPIPSHSQSNVAQIEPTPQQQSTSPSTRPSIQNLSTSTTLPYLHIGASTEINIRFRYHLGLLTYRCQCICSGVLHPSACDTSTSSPRIRYLTRRTLPCKRTSFC